ncbi:uncharacterized protein [Amphiura filiformis]|uniref:uncharacterized protein n=1 Tax=Amphiura filiformis TaxID=82378 RepID=UPI003B20BCD6
MSIIGQFHLVLLLWTLDTRVAYTIVESPKDVFVTMGGTVRFNCTVQNRQADEDMLWFFESVTSEGLHVGSDLSTTYASSSGDIDVSSLSTFMDGQHGIYSTEVTVSSLVEYYILRIVNVTEDDSGIRFACGYRRKTTDSNRQGLLGDWVRLFFFLRCSFYAEKVETLFSETRLNILLNCKYPAETASPNVTWYLKENPISATELKDVSLIHTIGPLDVGQEFTCKADNIPVTLPPCIVIPANELLKTRLSQRVIVTTIASFVIISCYNVGTTSNNLNFNWFLNNSLLLENQDVQITDTNMMSTLLIDGVTQQLNNSKITCEVNVFSILKSNASATILVFADSSYDDEQKLSTYFPPATTEYFEAATSPQSPESTFPLAIVIGSSAGGLLLIVLLVLLLVCCVRRNSKRPGFYQSKILSSAKPINGHTNTSFDNYAINNNGIDGRQEDDKQVKPTYAMPNKTGKRSNHDMEMPVYALANKSRSSLANEIPFDKPDSHIPTYALVNKSKNGRPSSRLPPSHESPDKDIIYAYDDIPSVSASTLYDEVPRENNEDSESLAYAQVNFEDKKGQAQKLNGEDLDYADLDIPSFSHEPTDTLPDQYDHCRRPVVPPSTSLYSEVKLISIMDCIVYCIFTILWCLLFTCLITKGTILPSGQTVLEGGVAEFHCQVDDYGTLNDIDWIFTWAGDDVGLYIEAETTGVVGPSTTAFLKNEHGLYRTYYAKVETDFGRIHNCTLRIERVTKADEGKYNCAYYRRSKVGDFYEHITARSAELRVLVPPSDGNPKCSFLTTPSNLTGETWKEAHAKLSCKSSGGDPPAMLRWYTNEEEITSGKEGLNAVEEKLTENDNGRVFVCVATSPALSALRNCTVIPFQVPLSAEMEESIDILSVGQSARYICRGHGLPRIDKYSWFVDGLRIEDTHKRYFVKNITEGSVLTISDLRVADNSSKVTCEIGNPHGLSAIVSAEIQVHQTNNGDSESMTVPLTIGLIAMVLIITIAATVGFFVYREKEKSKNRNTDIHESGVKEYNRIESTGCKYEVSAPGSPTSNDQFAYANQGLKDDKDNLIVSSGPRVASSAYEVVQPKRAKTPKAYRNVEGLEYADLDLPSPDDEEVILNPQADEVVMYSQFKKGI